MISFIITSDTKTMSIHLGTSIALITPQYKFMKCKKMLKCPLISIINYKKKSSKILMEAL